MNEMNDYFKIQDLEYALKEANTKIASLTTWHPIETAPNDRWIQLSVEGIDHPVSGHWSTLFKAYVSNLKPGRTVAYQPSHWMELPKGVDSLNESSNNYR
jgi:hypothetical protein